MVALERLGVRSEADLERLRAVWVAAKSREQDFAGVRAALGEMVGVLERRSELTQDVRTRHREFSELKALKQRVDQFGESAASRNGNPGATPPQMLAQQPRVPAPALEVETLDQKHRHTRARHKALRGSLLRVRRALVELTKRNQALYEQMEGAERLSFKLVYFLLSQGRNARVEPVIDQSLLEATLRRAHELDSVFGTRAGFLETAKATHSKARELAGVGCRAVLEAVWEKAGLGQPGGFSLFREFKVGVYT